MMGTLVMIISCGGDAAGSGCEDDAFAVGIGGVDLL